jgi:DNA adenine methylase
MATRSRAADRAVVRAAGNLAPARTLPARPRTAPAVQPSAAPVVKWVGGKTKLLPELLARMPSTIARYYEPFAGGAALFFRLAPAHAVLNDDNLDLVTLYRALSTDPDSVSRRLQVHQRLHDSDHYYAMRARWNDPSVSWTALDRAAAFVYLNKTCFNGLWRVNRAGHFNVPMGRYDKPPICVPEALHAAGRTLARCELRRGDFRAAVADARRGDFVYFDPPYDPVTPTANFTGYTAGAFGPEEQRSLASLASELVARGCKVMLSNSDTDFIRSLYRDFRVDRVRCARAINSNASRRGEVNEVVITGGYLR